MATARACGAILGCAAAACALDAQVITVPVAGARTLILIAAPAGGARSVRVIPLPMEDPALASISVPFAFAGPATLTALEYACTPEALGLTAGEESGVSGVAPGPALAIFSRTAERDWTRLDALPTELADLRLARQAPSCPALERVQGTTGTDAIALAIADSADSAVLRTESGHFFRARGGETVPLPALDASAPAGVIGGVREDATHLVLVAGDGTTVRADPALGVEARPALPGPLPARWIAMDASRARAAFEAFALSDRGTFARYDGAAWTLLDQDPEQLGAALAVAWLAPGEALGAGGEPPAIRRWKAGGIAREQPGPVDSMERVTALAVIEGLGTVAGTDRGGFYAHDGSAWMELAGSPLHAAIRAISPRAPGFVAYDEHGDAAIYTAGFCPASNAFTATLGARAVLEGGGLLATSPGDPPGRYQVARLPDPPATITCAN